MKIVKNIVDRINDELCDAQMYAEKMIEAKSVGDSKWASRYKSMAEDEMTHAMNMHDLGVETIEKIRSVYEPNQDMLDKWEHAHKEYVEKAAWIKQMMTL